MYQEEKSVLAERMTELRKKHNFTQEDIAKYLDCNRATVANYENGKRQPDYNTLIKLAQKYSVSTDYLLGLTDITTTDKDLKFICDYTGLSEKSVITLNKFKEMANGDIGIDDVPEKFYKYTILCETFDEEKTLREYILTSEHVLMFLNSAINNSYITDVAEKACDWHLNRGEYYGDLEEYRYIKACLKLLQSCELEFEETNFTKEDMDRAVQLIVETCKKAGEP